MINLSTICFRMKYLETTVYTGFCQWNITAFTELYTRICNQGVFSFTKPFYFHGFLSTVASSRSNFRSERISIPRKLTD